jgi:hypothetical protein
MTIEFHPLAHIFPLIEGADFDALVADIKAHGLAEKIVMHEGRPLDGRNRWRALVRIGLTDEEILCCHTERFVGTDPLAFVISKNLKRRHLSESQRAMVAAELAKLKLGANQHSEGPSIEEASKLLNVGHASVERARVVREQGAPELVAAVKQGEVSVSAAAVVATQPVEQQRELVARGEKEIIAAASKIRTQKRERKTAQARAADTERTEAPQPSPEQQPDATLSEPTAEAPPPDPYFATIEGIVATLSNALASIEDGQDLSGKAIAVKEIRDKALAAERQFREIRSSAQLRAGELLLEMGKAGIRETGKPTKGRRVGTYTTVPKLRDLGGITRKQSQDWQRLAKRQRRKLEAALAGKTVRRRSSLRRHRRRSRPAA